jgi:hypothetical protein
MKKVMLLLLFVAVAAGMAMADLTGVPQQTALTTDVLGAHLLYGRGCVGCHAPHSGAAGNGGSVAKDNASGDYALWGQDLTPLYGQPLAFGDGGKFAVTLPAQGAITSAHDPTTVILFCLSCHDGNLATGGHMKGVTVESLPIWGGNPPTLLGNDGTKGGNYANDHPVGINAAFGCGGQYNWDCTIGATGTITMGPKMTQFATVNYTFAVSLPVVANVPVVTCTSCHDQHSELVFADGGSPTVAPTAFYQTAFFLRGYYNPTTGGNNAAQFCRQCHGGESNEMHGQMNVPTT